MSLVSVIVPTFNRAHCLARAIDSALAQSHGDLEILIIDDGSTDGTQALIRDRYGRDSRVRYIHQENQGVSAARNTGIRASRGAFVALLDSDDVWRPWKLEIQLACFEFAPQVGMVWSDMEAIDRDGRVTHPRFLRTMYSCWRHYPDPNRIFADAYDLEQIVPARAVEVAGDHFYAGDVFSQMIRGSLVHTSTVVLRRERLEQVGLFNEQLKPAGEDFEFHLRTCHAGPVGFLDTVTIQYQIGMEDRLTRPEHTLAVATNFLNTIEPFLRDHRAEIRLTKADIRAVLAEAHHWIGEEQFGRGNHRDARQHLARSLGYRFWQGRVWALMAASCLPARWFASRP